MDSAKKVCVIGAGSSGIVAVKTMKEHGLEVACFEKGSGIGGNWRFRNDNGMSASYASLHINTSKEKMAYADYPMPDDYPDYPHHSQILTYFEDYVDHFGIRDLIQFKTEVRAVEPLDGGGWRVDVAGPEGDASHELDAVLVANGHHWSPRMPEPPFPGPFNGRAFHSHEYETFEGFEGTRALIVGIGNSAVDIACEVSRVAEATFLSTRRSAHILPKYAFGKPIDHFTTPASAKTPVGVQRRFFEAVLSISRGPQHKFGVPVPDHHILQAHPTISADLLNLVGHGQIQMKPNLERLAGDDVVFVDGSRETIDIIVYATGYKIRFPFLRPELVNPEANEVRFFRHVVPPRLSGLYFLGLIQPLGAIMPLAEAQAQWIGKLLTGRAVLPDAETMERQIELDHKKMRQRYVTSKRHTIQVDFYPYLHQIQREMQRRA